MISRPEQGDAKAPPAAVRGLHDIAVVSCGFGKLNGPTVAREASDRGLLHLAITGAYPTPALKRLTRRLRIDELGRSARLMERDEGIPADRLAPLLATELVFEIVRLLRRVPLIGRIHTRLHISAMRLYGLAAARQLRRRGGEAKIFHVLSGYGHTSIAEARRRGMFVLVDHAIAHPLVLNELIRDRGQLRIPEGGPTALVPRLANQPHLRAILADLDRADSVLVNSQFVKETFVALGWDPDRVHVAYWGVDDNFLGEMEAPRREPDNGPLRMLFAGRFERRKGTDMIVEALTDLDSVDWQLTIAGPIASDLQADHAGFLADPRVRLLGTVLRPKLRDLMLSTPVFLFPSYAEGSARVAFEALACGCYLITTPNTGSIVEDGIHGALVEPGDAEAVRKAIEVADRERDRIAAVGSHNARVVAEQYRQRDFGTALARIYEEIAKKGGRYRRSDS